MLIISLVVLAIFPPIPLLRIVLLSLLIGPLLLLLVFLMAMDAQQQAWQVTNAASTSPLAHQPVLLTERDVLKGTSKSTTRVAPWLRATKTRRRCTRQTPVRLFHHLGVCCSHAQGEQDIYFGLSPDTGTVP